MKLLGRPQHVAFHRSGWAAAILSIAFLLASCSRSGTFRRLEVDSATLKLNWSEPIWKVERDGKVFYQVLPNQRNRHFIDELVLPIGSEHQFRYNAFHVDDADRLITRSKYQELLSGEFGVVYAETTYHYADSYKNDDWATSFTTELYTPGIPHEPFQIVDAFPPASTLKLSAISLVRVFKNGAEFVVVSANYAHDGHFESISVSGSKNGTWLGNRFSIPGIEGIGHGQTTSSGFKTRETFGLPRTFPVASYLAHPTQVFDAAILSSALDVVNLHYDMNQWVKQDFYDQQAVRTRFLMFRPTPEDLALEKIDRKRLFGEHPYTREPNWEEEHAK